MLRTFIFVIVSLLLLAKTACADFTFRGNVDLLSKELNLEVNIPDNGLIFFKSIGVSDDAIDFDIAAYDLKTLVFDISTSLSGTAKVVKRKNKDSFIRGAIGMDMQDPNTGNKEYASLGTFEFRDDKFFLDPIFLKGLTARGYLSLLKPYAINFSLIFLDVSLVDFLSWVNPEHNLFLKGGVSGKIQVEGLSRDPEIKGSLNSYGGQIEDFEYDNIVLNFQGMYPTFNLTQTSITEEGGVSANVEGVVDLSKGFDGFEQQIARLKVAPLIRETDVQREWTIRKEKGEKGESETQFKYLMRTDPGSLGDKESDMLTIQKNIKF